MISEENTMKTREVEMEETLSPFAFLRPELDRVEKRIRAQAEDFDPAVEPYVGYILDTSGKRIRPALTFLAGHNLQPVQHALKSCVALC